MLSKISETVRTVSSYVVVGAATLYLGKFVKDRISKPSSGKSNSLKNKNLTPIKLTQKPTEGTLPIADLFKSDSSSYSSSSFQPQTKIDVLAEIQEDEDTYSYDDFRRNAQEKIAQLSPYKEAWPFVQALQAILDKFEPQRQKHEGAIKAEQDIAADIDKQLRPLTQPLTDKHFSVAGPAVYTVWGEHQAFATDVTKILKQKIEHGKGINHVLQHFVPVFQMAGNLTIWKIMEDYKAPKEYEPLKDPVTEMRTARRQYDRAKTDVKVKATDLQAVLDEQKKLNDILNPQKKKQEKGSEEEDYLLG